MQEEEGGFRTSNQNQHHCTSRGACVQIFYSELQRSDCLIIVFNHNHESSGTKNKLLFTFMSLTIAWNRPPRAPHSFSTVSMFAKSTIHRNLRKRAPTARYQHSAGKEKIIQKCISTQIRGAPEPPLKQETEEMQKEEEEKEEEEEEEGEKMPREAAAAVCAKRGEMG